MKIEKQADTEREERKLKWFGHISRRESFENRIRKNKGEKEDSEKNGQINSTQIWKKEKSKKNNAHRGFVAKTWSKFCFSFNCFNMY